MKDYKKPLRLRDKLKKSLGMKVRQKYESIPLLSEEEIRKKYKEEDWGFLVNYVKQHRNELVKKDNKLNFDQQFKDYTLNKKSICPEHQVKLIKIAWQIHHSQGAGNFPEYVWICPICGRHWGDVVV